jgi:hypothetical protein
MERARKDIFQKLKDLVKNTLKFLRVPSLKLGLTMEVLPQDTRHERKGLGETRQSLSRHTRKGERKSLGHSAHKKIELCQASVFVIATNRYRLSISQAK